ncbi:MAG: TRAP transporter TatT component family protein [Gammaproteobacteria bacterium]|nr:TRAP transporter TatT component family protein [Gammaproteobacteria bacterium]MDH3935248.1 TRAP transporter TatT component family protein [Gammaproteobacteria bacterium]MDH3970757.1 TRAP transporter TatT component family protein [Gammaproteobacteria bacterium]MDH3986111.1 TRAP transporter TatT component family protein [Gammaproteobacteria bacterium]
MDHGLLSRSLHILMRLAVAGGFATLVTACSMGQMVVRGSQTILDSGVDSMNRETDLQLARDAMPANLKLIEGMLIEDPGNTELRLFAAEGFYGYSFGFIETENPPRAKQLYRRCYGHAQRALQQAGVDIDPEVATSEAVEAAVGKAGKKAVPALFWTASCLGKWIDLSRDDLALVASLANVAILMERVLELDNEFYFGGAHLFFGVYYGGRSPMLGGDFTRAEAEFRRAAEINDNKLLIVNLLQAEFLDRQRLDQQAFHQRLTAILAAPDDLYPEMALINGIARQKAALLLDLEEEWF